MKAKAETVENLRDKILRLVSPKDVGSARDSQVWTWEERRENSGWYTVQHASGNREYSSEDPGSLAETHSSGNRGFTRKVVQNKNQLRHDEGISEIFRVLQ